MKNPYQTNGFGKATGYEADVMKDPKFYTKGGFLTPYALACGYIEQIDIGEIRLSMSKPSPGNEQYDVQRFNHGPGENMKVWDCYDTLPEARRAFIKLVRETEANHVHA